MKTLNLLLLLAALLLSSGSASGAQSSSLEGTWYVGGDRGKVARITNNRGRLEARNENGDTSRLEYNGRSRVRALDWGGITGEIRGNRIDWSNNTYWSKVQSSVTRYSNLEGAWYVGGDRSQVTSITNNRGRLEARNERGETSRLEYDGRSRVRALDWGGITGEIRGNRIDWSNNTYWSRSQSLLRATVTWKARGMLAAIAPKSPASRMTGADWQQEMSAATPADSITTVGDGCARSTGRDNRRNSLRPNRLVEQYLLDT